MKNMLTFRPMFMSVLSRYVTLLRRAVPQLSQTKHTSTIRAICQERLGVVFEYVATQSRQWNFYV